MIASEIPDQLSPGSQPGLTLYLENILFSGFSSCADTQWPRPANLHGIPHGEHFINECIVNVPGTHCFRLRHPFTLGKMQMQVPTRLSPKLRKARECSLSLDTCRRDSSSNLPVYVPYSSQIELNSNRINI